MNRQISVAIAVLAVIVSLAGPSAAAGASAKKDLTVTFHEKRIQDLSGVGLTLNFVFKVVNASTAPWFATGYDYRVVVENTGYFSVRDSLAQAITISPSSATLIALPVKITNENLFKAVPSAEGKDKLSCYLIGGMSFSENPGSEGSRLAVACSGDFPVFRDIGILFRPLEVMTLTIGGGDVAFKASLTNDNAFAMRVESLCGTLDLGGTRVSEGRVSGVTALGAKGTQEFSIPLLLDFFEIGNALYGLLQKPSIPCRFSGTIEIETGWGRFSMPLERLEDIPVQPAPGR